MKRFGVVCVLAFALVLAAAMPVYAGDGAPVMAVGSAALLGYVGGGAQATGNLSCSFKAASGVPGTDAYRPASGYLEFTSPAPGLTFRVTPVDVYTTTGAALIYGVTADGSRYDVLVWDGGTPGAGYDEVYVSQHLPEGGRYVTTWYVTDGNLAVKSR